MWCVIAARRDVARAVHADPHTMVRVARAMAAYADHRTGRDCRPTNDRLADDLALSTRQLQRARAGLKQLGLVVEVVRGRSYMTRTERLAAWRRGSRRRRIAAEFALTSVRHRPSPTGLAVDRVTPPAVRLGYTRTPKPARFFGTTEPRTTGAPRRPPTTTARTNRTPVGIDLQRRRLIDQVRHRIGWIGRISPRRLTALHRLADAGWNARDVHLALDQVLRARHWNIPNTLRHPAAYLAALLRDVDAADRPTALEEAMWAEEQLRRDWHRKSTLTGAPCRHGQPGGDLPHPLDGHLSCPLCRRTTSL